MGLHLGLQGGGVLPLPWGTRLLSHALGRGTGGLGQARMGTNGQGWAGMGRDGRLAQSAHFILKRECLLWPGRLSQEPGGPGGARGRALVILEMPAQAA